MRIIFFTTKLNFETGGGSTPELDLRIRALTGLGHEVRVVTLFPGINRGAMPVAYEVIEERIGTSGQLAVHWGVYRILKKYEGKADVFCVDGVVFLYGAGLYRMLGGTTPVVAGFNREQTSFPPFRKNNQPFSLGRMFASLRRNVRYWVEKTFGVYLANHIDRFTYGSPLLRDLYVRFGLDAKKSFFVYDFFDADEALRHKHPFRKHSGTSFTIFTAGRMVWEKGLDLTLTAVAQMEHHEGVQLVIAGDGPERPSLEALTKKLGLQDIVRFAGWLSAEELFTELQKADCLIVPCWRKEIASAFVFYAMAVGVPVIVPAGGALEWFAGGASVTFEDFNTRDLAEKIALLMRDEQLCMDLVEKGYIHARKLDYRGSVKALEKVLRDAARS